MVVLLFREPRGLAEDLPLLFLLLELRFEEQRLLVRVFVGLLAVPWFGGLVVGVRMRLRLFVVVMVVVGMTAVAIFVSVAVGGI